MFKSTLQPHNATVMGQPESKLAVGGSTVDDDPSGAVANGWYEDRYQPRFVTACDGADCVICNRGRGIDLGVCGDGDVEMG